MCKGPEAGMAGGAFFLPFIIQGGVGFPAVLILQRRKRRLREGKPLVQRHTACNSQDSLGGGQLNKPPSCNSRFGVGGRFRDTPWAPLPGAIQGPRDWIQEVLPGLPEGEVSDTRLSLPCTHGHCVPKLPPSSLLGRGRGATLMGPASTRRSEVPPGPPCPWLHEGSVPSSSQSREGDGGGESRRGSEEVTEQGTPPAPYLTGQAWLGAAPHRAPPPPAQGLGSPQRDLPAGSGSSGKGEGSRGGMAGVAS